MTERSPNVTTTLDAGIDLRDLDYDNRLLITRNLSAAAINLYGTPDNRITNDDRRARFYSLMVLAKTIRSSGFIPTDYIEHLTDTDRLVLTNAVASIPELSAAIRATIRDLGGIQ